AAHVPNCTRSPGPVVHDDFLVPGDHFAALPKPVRELLGEVRVLSRLPGRAARGERHLPREAFRLEQRCKLLAGHRARGIARVPRHTPAYPRPQPGASNRDRCRGPVRVDDDMADVAEVEVWVEEVSGRSRSVARPVGKNVVLRLSGHPRSLVVERLVAWIPIQNHETLQSLGIDRSERIGGIVVAVRTGSAIERGRLQVPGAPRVVVAIAVVVETSFLV